MSRRLFISFTLSSLELHNRASSLVIASFLLEKYLVSKTREIDRREETDAILSQLLSLVETFFAALPKFGEQADWNVHHC